MLDDKKILIRARKVFTSNWFDLHQVRIRVTRGVIHVQGHIQRLTGSADEREGSESSLRHLDEELHGIPGCRGVNFECDNWIHEPNGGWRPKRHRKEEQKGSVPRLLEPEEKPDVPKVQEQ